MPIKISSGQNTRDHSSRITIISALGVRRQAASTMRCFESVIPYEIMKKASLGILFSDLINDDQLLKDYDSIDQLVSRIHKIMSLDLVHVEKIDDQENGDDYFIKLNLFGEQILKRRELATTKT